MEWKKVKSRMGYENVNEREMRYLIVSERGKSGIGGNTSWVTSPIVRCTYLG